MEKKERRRKKYQRKIARQIKGSNRRDKTRKQSLLRKIGRDWIHKTTREIARKCGTVVVEDLKVKNMTGKGYDR